VATTTPLRIPVATMEDPLLVVVLRWPMTHLTGGRSVPCPEESHEWMQLYKILRVLLAHWGHIGFIEPISNVKLEI